MADIRTRALQIFVTVILAVVAASALATLQVQQAHAYSYVSTNSGSIYNRLWISVSTNGVFEMIGSDPVGPWSGAPSLFGGGPIQNYSFATWSDINGQDDIQWYNGTSGSWVRGGAVFGSGVTSWDDYNANGAKAGTGWGCVPSYGYGVGFLSLNNHSGLDALMYTHVYINNAYWNYPLFYEAAAWYPRVKIQYDANGGTGAPGSHYKYMGNAASVSSTKPTRTGYTFEGWSLTQGGSIQIAAGQRIGYMDWNYACGLTTSGANGVWSPPSNTPHTANNTAPGVPTPTGSNTITLYAVWKPITYTISFNGNGATSGTTAKTLLTYDISGTLTANGYAYNGAYFTGWNTKANGSGVNYANAATIKNVSSTQGANITLYAQWATTVRYSPNGVTSLTSHVNSSGQTVTIASNMYYLNGSLGSHTAGTAVSSWDPWNFSTLCLSKTARAGYHIEDGKEWNTSSGGSGTSFDEDVVYSFATIAVSAYAQTKSSSLTLYANWQKNPTAKVSFVVDGTSGLIDPVEIEIGTAYSVPATATSKATKSNCNGFDGWYTDKPCTIRFTNGSVISANLTLYSRNKVSVSYGYTFPTENLLTAHQFYKDSACNVVYDAAVGEGLPASANYWYGDTLTLPTFAYSRLYYQANLVGNDQLGVPFVGYWLNLDQSGAAKAAGSKMVLTSKTTIYAGFELVTGDGIRNINNG